MEITNKDYVQYIDDMFKIDLIVWKSIGIKEELISIIQFKIDLIVWKY